MCDTYDEFLYQLEALHEYVIFEPTQFFKWWKFYVVQVFFKI